MSGFATNQWTEAVNISSDVNAPTNFQYTWQSFDTTNTYLMLVDGIVNCPIDSGNVTFDTLMNGAKIYPTRSIQTSVQGSSTVSQNWPVKCVDCVQTTDSDGNTIYNNTITFSFLWHQSSATSPAVPSLNSLSFSVLAVE